MDILEIIQKRRSIRLFDEMPVSEEILENIAKYALLAPSGRNLRPVELVIVQDKNKIKKIMKTREEAFSFLNTAPACIVVAANEDSSTWLSDASIVAAYIQLLAVNFGLGSCWGHVHDRYYNNLSVEGKVKEILNIPDGFRVLCIIGIGYPNEEKQSHSLDDVETKRIHKEKW